MPDTPIISCPICAQEGARQAGFVDGRDMPVFQCPRCGTFGLDPAAASAVAESWSGRRHLLTAAIRAASDAKRLLQIELDDLESLAASVPQRVALVEAVDRLLLFLASRTREYWSQSRFNKDTDYPLIFASSPEEMNYLLITAGDLGYFDIHQSKFTRNGWIRVDQLRATIPTSQQAFVAMWFDKSLNDAWLNGFKPAIEQDGYFRAIRVDAVEHNDKVDDRIIAEIRRSGLLVADFTGHRGGVYFEAGFARGLGIPVIWTVRQDDVKGLHFDTRQFNHIVWNDPIDLRAKLNTRIAATVLPRPDFRAV